MFQIICLKSKFLRGIFNQNTYVLLNEDEAILIDAGADVNDIKDIVGSRKVLGVLMTHLHFDHIWNLSQILSEFKCNVYISKGCENRFSDATLNASNLIKKEMKFEISQRQISYFEENMSIGTFQIKVYNTPGHSRDSVCFLIGDSLFTGDTVFFDSIGRTDLPDSNDQQMIRSLRKIREIDFSIAYPGHYDSCEKSKILQTINMYV